MLGALIRCRIHHGARGHPRTSKDEEVRLPLAPRSGPIVVCLVAGAILVSLLADPARAWSNGVDGPNSYGTHDWIIDQALQAVGEQADWVHTRVALRATDDPDTRDGIDHASGTWWHVYDRWGETYGGADEAARVCFQRLERRVAQKEYRRASKALGYLAHLVGDVAQPMHTDSSRKEDRVHSLYESAVDRRVSTYRFSYEGRDAARAGPKTRLVARRAHRYYWDLVRAYDAHGYNDKVDRITRRQLQRAANALADLISSI